MAWSSRDDRTRAPIGAAQAAAGEASGDTPTTTAAQPGGEAAVADRPEPRAADNQRQAGSGADGDRRSLAAAAPPPPDTNSDDPATALGDSSDTRPMPGAEPVDGDFSFHDDLPIDDGAGISAFRYHIDQVTDAQIEGWIARPDQPAHRYIVALREGDRVVARAIASRFRADLVTAGFGDGCHAFILPMPPALLDGQEHLLHVVEQETGFALTPEPVRWRYARPGGQTAFGGMAHRLGAARLFDLRQQPGREADSGLMRAWSGVGDGGTSLSEARYVGGARSRATRPAMTQTRLLFDISDLVYYIGHHANLTGIQRVQSSIVLAILSQELFPEAGLTFLSFNAPTLCRDWVTVGSILPSRFSTRQS